MNLCEFIEDCEFTELSVRILHLLGDEGHTLQTLHTISDIFTIDWFWRIPLSDLQQLLP